MLHFLLLDCEVDGSPSISCNLTAKRVNMVWNSRYNLLDSNYSGLQVVAQLCQYYISIFQEPWRQSPWLVGRAKIWEPAIDVGYLEYPHVPEVHFLSTTIQLAVVRWGVFWLEPWAASGGQLTVLKITNCSSQLLLKTSTTYDNINIGSLVQSFRDLPEMENIINIH